MKISKKIICIALAAVMSLGVFAGCGKVSDSVATGANGKKILKVGMECSNAPFNWIQTNDANGGIKISDSNEYANGFDVQMMKKLCDLAGYEFQPYKVDWDGMLLGVQTGTYDAAISCISITDKRKITMDFSDPYYVAGIVVLTRKDGKFANAKTLSDLNGANVTSMLNTVWYDMCNQIPNAKIQPALENVPALVVSVNSKAVDIVTCDEPTAMSAIASNPDLVMIKPDSSNTFKVKDEDVNLGIAFSKGHDQVVKDINEALKKIPQADKEKMLKDAIKNQPLSK